MLEDSEETLLEARVAADVALAAVMPASGVERGAACRCAALCRTICRASASWCRDRRRVRAEAGIGLIKLGEYVTETLERIPARWFAIQHVREKFVCRACETIAPAPAPLDPVARGQADANLLAEIGTAKFGMHLPPHRRGERVAREGVPITGSTLVDGGRGHGVARPARDTDRGSCPRGRVHPR